MLLKKNSHKTESKIHNNPPIFERNNVFLCTATCAFAKIHSILVS